MAKHKTPKIAAGMPRTFAASRAKWLMIVSGSKRCRHPRGMAPCCEIWLGLDRLSLPPTICLPSRWDACCLDWPRGLVLWLPLPEGANNAVCSGLDGLWRRLPLCAVPAANWIARASSAIFPLSGRPQWYCIQARTMEEIKAEKPGKQWHKSHKSEGI